MLQNLRTAVLGALVLVLAGAGAALAHHSFAAEFDSTKPIAIEGVVTKFQWSNPHSWIHIEVVNEATGEVENWQIEGGAPSPLLRRGWTRDSLPAGTPIKVEGYRARDGATRASATNITFPDGRVMQFGSSGRGSAPGRGQ